MEYIDIINDWTGETSTVGDASEWAVTMLDMQADDGEWPIIRCKNGTVLLLHGEGPLRVNPQGDDTFDDDPDLEVLMDEIKAHSAHAGDQV